MTKKTFWTKRPTLADRLFANGENGKCVTDTFDNGRKRWIFDATITGLSIVIAYYREIDRPLPKQYEILYKEIIQGER